MLEAPVLNQRRRYVAKKKYDDSFETPNARIAIPLSDAKLNQFNCFRLFF